MRHIMLDIETLGTEPGCPILSVAMVDFDPYALINKSSNEVEKNTVIHIDLLSQLLDGFVINDATLDWWRNQSDEARAAAVNLAYKGPCDALFCIRDFIIPTLEEVEIKIWAKSPDFDCAIVERLFEFYEIKCPWSFRDKMDVRTIVTAAGKFSSATYPINNRAPNQFVPHDPLSDCFKQIDDVQQAVWRMRHGTA